MPGSPTRLTVLKHSQESLEKPTTLKMTTIEIDGEEYVCFQCDCECIIEEHEHTLNIKPEECSQDKVPHEKALQSRFHVLPTSVFVVVLTLRLHIFAKFQMLKRVMLFCFGFWISTTEN